MNTYFKIRTLTISSIFTKPLWSKPKLKPKLIIQGDWMQKAGFEIGEKVTISVSQNLLIIQKLDDKKPLL
jgi:toxic protein SymE